MTHSFTELKNYIDEDFKGTTEAFKYVLPVEGMEWNCSIDLKNSEYYKFDVENAASYVYVPEPAKKNVMAIDEKYGWLSGSEVSERGIEVSFDSGSVSVSSKSMLEATMPYVVVSIPVVYDYYSVETLYEIKQVDESFNKWVTECNVPDSIPDGKEYLELTHTLLFDEFIDKITDGYKNISEAGKKKEVKVGEPDNKTAVVDRLNIVIVAE